MTYLIILGAIVLFGVGVYVGTRFNAAKLKAIEGELQGYANTLSADARGLVAAIRKHL